MKDDILNRELVFGYYMNQEKLVFVDDTNTVSEMLQEIIGVQILDKTSVAHFFEFMEYLIRVFADRAFRLYIVNELGKKIKV